MGKISIEVGDEYITNTYGKCVIVEYVNSQKVKVKFITTGYECWCQYSQLKDGRIKDPYVPSVYGVGYPAKGEYQVTVNGKITKEYAIWHAIVRRCYDIKTKRFHRYGGRGVTVCKEWHNFQNFAQWCNEQPNFNKERFELDKDLRIKDSKEYSPETCSFVPQNVNTLLTSSNKTRGEHPVGVHWHNRDKVFESYCGNGFDKQVFLGCYRTSEEAFQVYKEYKENVIREVAQEEFEKGNIIKEVYDNLMKWEVIPFPD